MYIYIYMTLHVCVYLYIYMYKKIPQLTILWGQLCLRQLGID